MKKAVKNVAIKKGIKSATEFLYSFENGKLSEKGQIASLTLYNANGYETETCIFDDKDRVCGKVTYKYSEDGKVTELKGYDCIKGTECCRTYKYDECGRLIKETFHATDVEQIRTLYKYDEEGRIAEELNYTSTGDFFRKDQYEYICQDGYTEQTKFAGPIMMNKFIERMTQSGKETEDISYNEDGTVEERIIIRYNPENLPVEELRYNDEEKEPFKVTEYTYDNKANLIEENVSGLLDSFKKLIQYDNKNNIAEITFLDSNDRPEYLYKTVYEFY